MVAHIDAPLELTLSRADADDLHVLIDHITDNGDGRVSLSAASCAKLVAARASSRIDANTRTLIAHELTRFGGNSLINLFRGGDGVGYEEIVTDVAKHLKINRTGLNRVSELEGAIIEQLAAQSLEKMDETQRVAFFKQFGLNYTQNEGMAAALKLLKLVGTYSMSGYRLSALIAGGAVNALLGRTLLGGLGAAAGSAALIGPVTVALSVIWGLYGLASPAYRVTVPCVIHLAYMRRRQLFAHMCPACDAVPPPGARFCHGCGSALPMPIVPVM
jgi:uncharacterized protein YaaW (UPF0174 family)